MPIALDPVARAGWHPVALASDLPLDAVRPATLLGEDLVLWRGTDGPHAWQDLCVHRGVQLSLGRVVDHCSLRCAYHGWTYNSSGQCIQMPAHPAMKPPARAHTRTYPCLEHAGLLWVSLDPTLDEPRDITTTPPDLGPPHLAELTDPAFRTLPCGPYPAPAGAPRLIENFLDVAHLPIVHQGTLGAADQPEILPYEVELVHGLPLARDIRLFQPNPEGHARPALVSYEYGVLAPFTVYLRKHLPAHQCFTLLFTVAPLTETLSHAFFTILLNYGDPAQDAAVTAFQHHIFAQDLPIVSSQRPERLPLDLAEELHLPSDRLAIAYRQYIRKLGLSFGTA
ncbi:molybdenum cofactor-independent xanthine hydroxylase subunit HpxD [soil metagenome]